MSMAQMLTELTEVTPSLYISSATAITEQKLNSLGINLIVNATKGKLCLQPVILRLYNQIVIFDGYYSFINLGELGF